MARKPNTTIAIPADPSDPDDFDVTEKALQHGLAERRKRMGRPPSGPGKEQVTLRLDVDVLAKFRATGAGWQTRVNDALRRAQP
ncbi:BrnA antitoxin family protein [Sphingobium sp. KCTC 72723]|uniref:BrnA antitoxin family protein n=1 Tax=Sphingobium sp. KCTC 72723 TaxID=2733867 RepID=UPI00165EB312|nr:BrnA antitoxin family protein [Sphingobium sp. KCTC 72723]